MATIVDFQKSGELVKKPSLDLLMKLVTKDLDKVNATILEHMQSPVHLIPQLAGHLIAAGGKRLRPMLTLGTASLCQYSGDRHIKLAACGEFIHTATLLHDDVVDASELRRGKLTANTVWGNQASVLVGDFLFSRAFQLMVTDGSLHVLKLLSNASAVIAEGEVHQMLTTNDTTTSEADYLEVIQSKDKKTKSIGIPLHVDVIVILDSWHTRTRWWRKDGTIDRKYFDCLMRDGRRMTIFLDIEKDKWFQQRT